MVMFMRMLSWLTTVRVTVGYAATLVAVAMTLLILGPGAQDIVVRRMSTNLHNLVHGNVGTLLGSAFVTENGPIYVWLPGLFCLLALAELLWHSGRLVLTFSLGHIGATLIVAVGLAAAIRFGWTPLSAARDADVGISYGATAVLGALTAAVPARWRPAWVGWWLAVGVVVLCAHRDFTDVGHIVALGLGMLLSLRFRSACDGTWFRVVLLTVGALFGYLIVVNGLPLLLPPMAGALGAAAVLLLVVHSRLRHVRKSLTPLPAEQPALT